MQIIAGTSLNVYPYCKCEYVYSVSPILLLIPFVDEHLFYNQYEDGIWKFNSFAQCYPFLPWFLTVFNWVHKQF